MLIQQVCPDSAQHETVCRLLLAPYNDGIEFRKNLSEWWEDVLKSSKPNIFSISIADVDLSAEVVEVLEAQGCKIANGVIVCGEMMVTLSATLIKALEEADNLAKLQASSTMPDIIKVLTELATLSSGSRGPL